jgi:hypothetical protein
MEMVVTPMAMGTMEETRETTPMAITMKEMGIKMESMDIRMEEMGSTVTTRELTRTFRISPVSSAGRLDTLQMTALKRSKMRPPSPIH